MTKDEKRKLSRDLKFNAGKSNPELAELFHVSVRTIQRWLVHPEEGKNVRDQEVTTGRGRPRSYSGEIYSKILNLKRENPVRSAPVIHAHLSREFPGNCPSVSTVRKIIASQGLSTKKTSRRKGYIKFERASPNDLWQIDIAGTQSVGQLGKLYLCGILDDCSRYVVAARYFSDLKAKNIILLLREAFINHGRPNQILADNGMQFRATLKDAETRYTQLLKTLGIIPVFARPRHPQTKGKLERWFGVVAQMWLVDQRPVVKKNPGYTLDRFNSDFTAWLHFYNHEKQHRSLQGNGPPARIYFETGTRIDRPLETTVNWDLWLNDSVKRKVTKYNTIKYAGQEFSIPEGYSGLKVNAVETANSLDIYYKNTQLVTHPFDQLSSAKSGKSREHERKIAVSGMISWKNRHYYVDYKHEGRTVEVVSAACGKRLGIYLDGVKLKDIDLKG